MNGSNAVNVFLGLGLPWVYASLYNSSEGKKYVTPAGDLAYSVVIFLLCSLICYIILMLRRIFIGGELGGPKLTAYASAGVLVLLWVIYITLSTIKATSGWPENFP